MKRKPLLILLSVVCGAAIIVGAANLLAGATEYGEGESVYEELAQFVTPAIPTEDMSPMPTEEPTVAARAESDSQRLQVDFDGLRAVNPDVVAWLYCEGTEINYPIVQGKDNAFYLDHLFAGESNSTGCLFMDFNNKPDFSDRNTVIYGHNMNNGSMFADLLQYKSQAFYDAHPRMALVTPEDTYVVELISTYVAHTSEDSWKTAFASEDDLRVWLDDARNRSAFRSDVEASVEDRFVTFSTCTYGYEDARFVVVGRMISVASSGVEIANSEWPCVSFAASSSVANRMPTCRNSRPRSSCRCCQRRGAHELRWK